MSEKYTTNPNPSDPILFDSRGARRTASLFLETSRDKNKSPVLTLLDYEKNGLPSAYLIYMESETEYDAAMKLVGSMGHWRKLMDCPWFMSGDSDRGFTGLTQWRKDMAMRDANMAMTILRDKVIGGDKQSAQFLLNYSTKGDIAGGKGSAKVKKPKLKTVKEPQEKVADLSDLRAKLLEVPSGNQ